MGEMINNYLHDEHGKAQLGFHSGHEGPRQLEYIRRIFNLLFRIAAQYKEDDKNKKEFHEKVAEIKNKLTTNDELLFYTFFIAKSNKEFTFEWSYLLNKMDKISNFIITFQEHVHFLCKDIQNILNALPEIEGCTLVVDDYIKINPAFIGTYNWITLDLKNVSNLFRCKKDNYNLGIEIENARIGSYYRNDKSDVDTLVKSITTSVRLLKPTLKIKKQCKK